MKGYLTFLIVFAACALLLTITQFNLDIGNRNFAESIEVERSYHVALNIEDIIVEGAVLGAREGFERYVLTHPRNFRLSEAEEEAKRAALEKIETIARSNLDDRWDIEIGCFFHTPFSSIMCEDTVSVDIGAGPEGLSFQKVIINNIYIIITDKDGRAVRVDIPRTVRDGYARTNYP